MKAPHILLSLMLWLCAGQSQATNIKAVYLDNKLYWQNAYYIDHPLGRAIVPSVWTPVDNLPVTKTWVAGGLKSAHPSLTVHASTDRNVRIDFPTTELSLVGLEYHIGSSVQEIGDDSGNPSFAGCYIDLTLPTLSVIGAGNCLSDKKLLLTSGRQEPFAFIRPIFHIDEQAVINRFKFGSENKPYPAGIYHSDSQTFSAFYNYYYDPVDIPIPNLTRHYFSAAFRLEFDVKQTDRVDVVVVNGESQQMDVMYFPDGRIEGKANFEFKILGRLSNGYKMTLTNTRRSRTEAFLLAKSDDPTQTIPYSVKWRSADDAVNNNTQLVDDGELLIDHIIDQECLLSDGASCQDRHLDIEFNLSPEQAENVSTGIYQSQFVAMFEPYL